MFTITDGPACQWSLIMGDGHVKWLPWFRGGLGCGMAAPGGLVTCGNSATAGMVTVREEGVALFDHLSLKSPANIHFVCKEGCRFYS